MDNYILNHQNILFLNRFIKSPNTIGSIIPSSVFLARKMVREKELKNCRSVIEMGAGTGVFTRQLLETKPAHCKLYVFEKDPKLKELLLKKYPDLNMFGEAAQVKSLYEQGVIEQPDLIVSGLPFAVFSKALRNKILSGIYEILPEGGKFITFQYSLNLLKELRSLYSSVELDFEPINIPPAFIYRCTKGGNTDE